MSVTRYYDKTAIKPLFPFGHGLSYTKFEYSDIVVDKTVIDEDDTVTVSVDVKNTGAVDGAEIVQLYVADAEGKIDRPIRELKGFERSFEERRKEDCQLYARQALFRVLGRRRT